MNLRGYSCLAGNCPREILAGVFCAAHAYLNDSPVALWAVRQLDDATRERRGVWCNGDQWGFREGVSAR